MDLVREDMGHVAAREATLRTRVEHESTRIGNMHQRSPACSRTPRPCACMGTFYYMNQKHVVPEMCAVVFVRDRKRHAIASLNTGSLCCSEWILPNRTTESCAYISRSVYSYLWCWCLRWGIWVSGRSDQSFCADTDIFFPQPFRPFSRRFRIVYRITPCVIRARRGHASLTPRPGDAPFAARARLGTHVPAAHAFPQQRRQTGRHHLLSVE